LGAPRRPPPKTLGFNPITPTWAFLYFRYGLTLAFASNFWGFFWGGGGPGAAPRLLDRRRAMLAFIIRRLLSTVVVMTIVAIFIFLLLHLSPGDPAAIIVGDNATPAFNSRSTSLCASSSDRYCFTVRLFDLSLIVL
jgi:hypothetical protein